MFKRILVVRLSSAGDIILCTPVIEVLKAQFPSSEIDFLTKEEYAPLLYGIPFLDRVIPLRKSQRAVYPYILFLSTLRKNNYDLIVDLHKNFRTFLLRAMFSSIKQVVTNKGTFNRRMLVWFKRHIKSPKHISMVHLDSLQKLGISTNSFVPRLYLTDEEINLSKKLVDCDGYIVGIHPFARWKNKEWGFERYMELARRFAEIGMRVLVFSDGVSTEQIDFVKPSDWRELMMYISRCSLFVGNDSVGVHIANALDVPTVAIFGPTSPEFGFAPVGENVRVIYKAVYCSPCSLHGEKRCKKNLICMSSIEVDEVFSKGVELLGLFKPSGFYRS